MGKVVLKTQPHDGSVDDFIQAIADPVRRADCFCLVRWMTEVSGCAPVMWGQAIVGFGSYDYKYASGHGGTYLRIGFSPGKRNLSVYIMPGLAAFEDLLAVLGKHSKGKSCLYLKRLSDIDQAVLKQLLQAGWDKMARLYPL